MIYKWLQEYLKKYSFIDDVYITGSIIILTYNKDGKKKRKRLPYRATKTQLIKCINRIKKDIDYYEKRIKKGQCDVKKKEPFVVGFTSGDKHE